MFGLSSKNIYICPPILIIMAKVFTRKKLRLRAKARRRRYSLKTNPTTKGVKQTPEMRNHSVIKSLESKLNALQEAKEPTS